jgi:four helix bundle protein
MRSSEHLEQLKQRTKRFAVEIIRFHTTLPKSAESHIVGRNLVRAGTMVGVYFREATRARTSMQFIDKLENGLNSLDETAYWLEVLEESGITNDYVLDALRREAGELTSLINAFARRAKPQRRNLREMA